MDDNEIVADWPTTFGICCCCLSEGEYKDMMEEYVWIGEKEVYADMLQQCFDLIMMTIPEDDSKRLICEICVTRLRDASRFRIQVEDAQINYIDRMSTFRLSQTQQKQSTELKVEFDWQGGDSDDNYFDDPNFSHFKKTPDEDLDGEVDDKELVTKEVKKKAIKRKATKSKLKEVELTEEDIKAERGQLLRIQEIFNWTRRDVLNKDEIALETIRDQVKTSPRTKRSKTRDRKNFLNESINKDMLMLLAYTNLYPFEWAPSTYMCIFCKEKHRFITSLRSHVRNHNIQYVQQFNFSTAVRNRRMKLDTSTIVCEVCEMNYSSLKDVMDHLESDHGESFIMDVVTDNVMQFNMDNMSCQMCGEYFPNFTVLNEHMNIHFGNYICATCGKASATRTRHRYHQYSHNHGIYPCKKCDQVFDLKSKLYRHFAKAHKSLITYVCPYCDERFKWHHSRLRHLCNEHGEKNRYKCKICPATFLTNASLSTHVRRHHLRERNYKCQLCDAVFFQNEELQNHQIKHTGEKNFACTNCDKKYGRKRALVEHMRVHTNDKRFICAVCGKAFLQKCTLKGHMKTHGTSLNEELY